MIIPPQLNQVVQPQPLQLQLPLKTPEPNASQAAKNGIKRKIFLGGYDGSTDKKREADDALFQYTPSNYFDASGTGATTRFYRDLYVKHMKDPDEMESIEEKRGPLGYDSMDEEEEESEVIDEDRPLQIQSVNRMLTQNNSHEKDFNLMSQLSLGTTQHVNLDQQSCGEDQIYVQTVHNHEIILSERYQKQ